MCFQTVTVCQTVRIVRLFFQTVSDESVGSDVESMGSMVISRVSVEAGKDDKDDSINRIFSMMTTVKKRL